MKLYWVTVHTDVLEESVAFYERVLRLSVKRRLRIEAGKEIVFCSDGTTQIELISDDRPTASGGISIGFVTEEFEKTLQNCLDGGIEIILGPVKLGDSGECFFVRDPNGIGIQIMRGQEKKRRFRLFK